MLLGFRFTVDFCFVFFNFPVLFVFLLSYWFMFDMPCTVIRGKHRCISPSHVRTFFGTHKCRLMTSMIIKQSKCHTSPRKTNRKDKWTKLCYVVLNVMLHFHACPQYEMLWRSLLTSLCCICCMAYVKFGKSEVFLHIGLLYVWIVLCKISILHCFL